jgi:hypothetical protein
MIFVKFPFCSFFDVIFTQKSYRLYCVSFSVFLWTVCHQNNFNTLYISLSQTDVSGISQAVLDEKGLQKLFQTLNK